MYSDQADQSVFSYRSRYRQRELEGRETSCGTGEQEEVPSNFGLYTVVADGHELFKGLMT